MTRVLVTGGAGYIGSHTLRALQNAGIEAIVFDDFSEGHREAIRGFETVEGDLKVREAIRDALARNRVDGVIHFAASASVPESIRDPAKYY